MTPTKSNVLDLVNAAPAGVWQPIETAPKDDRHVLVIDCEGDQQTAFWDDDRWRDSWNGEDLGPLYIPTHWMPLPDPPVQP